MRPRYTEPIDDQEDTICTCVTSDIDFYGAETAFLVEAIEPHNDMWICTICFAKLCSGFELLQRGLQ
jgi:hypothetical protein